MPRDKDLNPDTPAPTPEPVDQTPTPEPKPAPVEPKPAPKPEPAPDVDDPRKTLDTLRAASERLEKQDDVIAELRKEQAAMTKRLEAAEKKEAKRVADDRVKRVVEFARTEIGKTVHAPIASKFVVDVLGDKCDDPAALKEFFAADDNAYVFAGPVGIQEGSAPATGGNRGSAETNSVAATLEERANDANRSEAERRQAAAKLRLVSGADVDFYAPPKARK